MSRKSYLEVPKLQHSNYIFVLCYFTV